MQEHGLTSWGILYIYVTARTPPITHVAMHLTVSDVYPDAGLMPPAGAILLLTCLVGGANQALTLYAGVILLAHWADRASHAARVDRGGGAGGGIGSFGGVRGSWRLEMVG